MANGPQTPALELARLPAKTDHIQSTSVQYSEDFPEDWEGARTILQSYSAIPATEVEDHIRNIRAQAYAIHPYPCVGRFRFLQLSISQHKLYPEVLRRLQTESECIILDMGCCFAQDLRRLAFDGAPTRSLVGADLKLEFLELGYELFRDEDRIPRSQFYEGDALADTGSQAEKDLARLDERVNVIHAASFLHLFDWDCQVKACCRMVRFFKPEERNALIFGRQVGSSEPGNYNGRNSTGLRFSHDARTFQELWDVVGATTNTRWIVDATLTDMNFEGDKLSNENKARKLEFAVRRVP